MSDKLWFDLQKKIEDILLKHELSLKDRIVSKLAEVAHLYALDLLNDRQEKNVVSPPPLQIEITFKDAPEEIKLQYKKGDRHDIFHSGYALWARSYLRAVQKALRFNRGARREVD